MVSVVVNVVLLSGFLLLSRASSNYICEECNEWKGKKGDGMKDRKGDKENDEDFKCEKCKINTETAECEEKDDEKGDTKIEKCPVCPTSYPGKATEEPQGGTTVRDCSLCPTMTSVYDCRSTSTEGVTSNPSSGSASSSRKHSTIDETTTRSITRLENEQTTSTNLHVSTVFTENKDMDQGSVLEQSAKTTGCSSGSIIGALIGGTLFGSAVTALVFLCIRRKLQTLHKKQSPSKSMQNPVYPLEDRFSQRIADTAQLGGAHYVEVDDDTQKSGNVSPLQRQDLESETTPVADDTYNLLNETDRIDVHVSDHYDHANPVPFPATLPDNGYGVVSFDSGDIFAQKKETSKNIPASNNNMSYEDVQNDDYFVLETQTV